MKSADERLKRLEALAGLRLDLGLSRLRIAAEAKAGSEAKLAVLAEQRPPSTLDPVREALAEARWQTWADARRAQLNLVLARQTAEWLQARDDARIDFGRNEALRGLRRKRDQAS